MTRGQFKQRALHLVQLPRGPVETALSRAYGSAIGTYLTGGGRLVSLFPSLTLVYRQCWLPLRFISRARAFVAFKYIPWELIEWNENVEVEIAAIFLSREGGIDRCGEGLAIVVALGESELPKHSVLFPTERSEVRSEWSESDTTRRYKHIARCFLLLPNTEV
ncbi:hypothetical protein CDV36_005215 [Fusarium kuroshium]|uniref:Uncharacterized protein n=1 Tax=Fusarium kuroshium TaxID=2010991 RepID=A0A3M2SBY3_9HYPO|nr:hypothetical protein CDV36_005215 [Fusarium kuroshium]